MSDKKDQKDKIVRTILKNSQLNYSICIMNKQQTDDMLCYLDNKLYYQLNNQLKEISNKNSNLENLAVNKLVDKIINCHRFCAENGIDFNQILDCVREINKSYKFPMVSTGGNITSGKIAVNKNPAKNKSTTSVVLQGITATLRSIIDRKFDKNEIDENLIEGAREKNMLISTRKHLDPTLSILDTTSAKKTKYLVGQISTNPGTEGQNQIHKINHPIIMSADSTEKNNFKASEIIKNITPNDRLDYQITMPLSEPPVGNTASTIIEYPSSAINDQTIITPYSNPTNLNSVNLNSANPTNLNSVNLNSANPTNLNSVNLNSANFSRPVEYVTVDSNRF